MVEKHIKIPTPFHTQRYNNNDAEINQKCQYPCTNANNSHTKTIRAKVVWDKEFVRDNNNWINFMQLPVRCTLQLCCL